MTKQRFWLSSVLVLVLFASFVLADTESTTVTFVIPSQVDHSISYGTVDSTCSSANFYFVENDAIKDGTQTTINASGNSGGAACQNTSVSATIINNIGSVNINVTANFTAALPGGVTVKAGEKSAGSCSLTAYSLATSIPYGAAVLIADDVVAQTGTVHVCWWADFSNFNGGVATTGVQATMNTHGIQN